MHRNLKKKKSYCIWRNPDNKWEMCMLMQLGMKTVELKVQPEFLNFEGTFGNFFKALIVIPITMSRQYQCKDYNFSKQQRKSNRTKQ